MPFYAYVISVSSQAIIVCPNRFTLLTASKEEDPQLFRYIVIFATREVADQWWRLIQTAAANNVPGWSTVSRKTPQFYTHKPSSKLIISSITENNVAFPLRTQIFFQLLNDRDGRLVDIIPTQVTVDTISGNQ